MFFNTSRENLGGYWINNMVRVPAGYSTQLLSREEAYGKWNDILINVKWTDKEEGFMKIWVNDKIKLDYTGPTKEKVQYILDLEFIELEYLIKTHLPK